MCAFTYDSLLTKQPTVHHAVHLASLRDFCAKSAVKILKEYTPSVKAPTAKKSAAVKKATSAAASSTSQNSARDEIDLASLDDIDAMGNRIDAGAAAAGADAGAGRATGWKSMFSSGGSSRDKSAYTK